jgi:hypothetical protein
MSERVFDTLPVLVNETGYSVNFGPNGYQPGWVYRYDHQNIEVHALNKDGADLLGHLSVEMLLNNPRTEASKRRRRHYVYDDKLTVLNCYRQHLLLYKVHDLQSAMS